MWHLCWVRCREGSEGGRGSRLRCANLWLRNSPQLCLRKICLSWSRQLVEELGVVRDNWSGGEVELDPAVINSNLFMEIHHCLSLSGLTARPADAKRGLILADETRVLWVVKKLHSEWRGRLCGLIWNQGRGGNFHTRWQIWRAAFVAQWQIKCITPQYEGNKAEKNVPSIHYRTSSVPDFLLWGDSTIHQTVMLSEAKWGEVILTGCDNVFERSPDERAHLCAACLWRSTLLKITSDTFRIYDNNLLDVGEISHQNSSITSLNNTCCRLSNVMNISKNRSAAGSKMLPTSLKKSLLVVTLLK